MSCNNANIIFVIYDFGNIKNTTTKQYFDNSVEYVFYSNKQKLKLINGKIVLHSEEELIKTVADYDYIVPICSNTIFFPNFFKLIADEVLKTNKKIFVTNKLFINPKSNNLKIPPNAVSDLELAILQLSNDLIFGNAYSKDFFINNIKNNVLVTKDAFSISLSDNSVCFATHVYYVLDERNVWNILKKVLTKRGIFELIKTNALILHDSGHQARYIKNVLKDIIKYNVSCLYDSCFYINGLLSKTENLLFFLNSIFILKWLAKIVFNSRRIIYKFLRNKSKLFLHGIPNVLNKRRFVFLGAPDYDNVGDHAIFIGSINFLKQFFPESQIIIFDEKDCFKNKKNICKVIKPEDTLFFQGGGNVGNEYSQELIRKYFLKHCPNNKTIIMPSTIFFTPNKKNYKLSLKKAEKYYSNNNLLFALREPKSFEFAKTHFNCSLFNCSDMALFIERKKRNDKTNLENNALVCLRNDKESSINITKMFDIIYNVQKNYKDVFISDTILNYSICSAESERVVNEYIDMFSHYSIVYTDRFHGIIISYLAETDCVAIPNYNHKVEMLASSLGGIESSSFVFTKTFIVKKEFAFNKNIFIDFAKKIKEHIG